MVSLNFVQIKKLGNMGWVAVFGEHQREDKDSAHQREDKTALIRGRTKTALLSVQMCCKTIKTEPLETVGGRELFWPGRLPAVPSRRPGGD